MSENNIALWPVIISTASAKDCASFLPALSIPNCLLPNISAHISNWVLNPLWIPDVIVILATSAVAAKNPVSIVRAL